MEKKTWNYIDNNTFNILLQLLFSGMACGHLENKEKWNWVYDYYDKIRLKYTTNYNKWSYVKI